MDAVEFIKERDRMMSMMNFAPNVGWGHEQSAEEIVAEVEEWSAAHPRRTRQSVFLEQYPNVRLIDGVVDIAPCQMEPKSYSSGAGGCKYAPCVICRSEFWTQEVD